MKHVSQIAKESGLDDKIRGLEEFQSRQWRLIRNVMIVWFAVMIAALYYTWPR